MQKSCDPSLAVLLLMEFPKDLYQGQILPLLGDLWLVHTLTHRTQCNCSIQNFRVIVHFSVSVSGRIVKWFEKECFDCRKLTRWKLHQCKWTKRIPDKQVVVETRKEHCVQLNSNRGEKRKMKKKRISMIPRRELIQPKLFWSELRSCSGLGQQCEPLTVPFEEVPGVTTLWIF